MSTPIIIAKKTTNTQQDVVLHSKFANRHGLSPWLVRPFPYRASADAKG